jgi:hypothetical protein
VNSSRKAGPSFILDPAFLFQKLTAETFRDIPKFFFDGAIIFLEERPH